MLRLLIGGLILVPLVTCVQSMAQVSSREIGVVQTIPGPIAAEAGEVTTVAVRISSSAEHPVRCLAMIDLPADWRRLIGEQGFDVRPGTEEVRLVSFAIPRDAPSGMYTASYVLRLADSGSELARVDMRVNILARLALNLEVLHAPRNAVAGGTYTATFRLDNQSNEGGKVRLRIRSIPGLPAQVNPDSLILFAGEIRDFDVTVTTDASATSQFRHALEVHAWFDSDPKIEAQATALVPVLPRKTFEGEELSIPLQFTFRNTGENRRSGSQLELFGTGSLAGGNVDHYEILLRGPDNRTQSLLGRRDEYRIAYEHSGNELVVGDQPFRLTPLTELGRYAFGASGRVNSGPWHGGGFVNQTRWSPARAREAGGYAGFNLNPDASVALNFLHKDETISSDILTAQGELRIAGQADVSVEFGGSQSPLESAKGLAFQVRSRPSWIQYNFNMIYAEPGYSGYYSDFDAKAFNVAVFPVDEFRVEGYYQDEKRGLDLDPALLHAPQNKQLQAGVGYGNSVAVYYKLVRHRDLLPLPKYDRQEETLVMHLGANFQSGSVFATVDVGRTEELLLHRSYPLRRLSLSTRFQPDQFQGYNVSLEYGSTKDLFTELTREGTSWSISAWYHLTNNLQLQAGVYQSWTIAPVRQMNTLGDATIEYTLPFGHRVSLMGRINKITSTYASDNVAYSFEYVVPFELSFSRTPDGGSLDGRIVDIESGLGLADVVLYAGDQVAITDGGGRFEFPNLREGTYAITVDRGNIGPDRIPSQPLPSDLVMTSGLERTLDIGITQAGVISGEVVAYRQEPTLEHAKSQAQGENIQGVTIELRNNGEVFRRLTDGRGRFTFRDLRPGTWIVSIPADEIPAELGGVLPKSIELKPGQTVEVPLELTAAKRKIRLLQEGTLLRMR